MITKLIAILALAAGTAGVFAVQHPNFTAASGLVSGVDDALPCAEGAEVPQIVVTAKREHDAQRDR